MGGLDSTAHPLHTRVIVIDCFYINVMHGKPHLVFIHNLYGMHHILHHMKDI